MRRPAPVAPSSPPFNPPCREGRYAEKVALWLTVAGVVLAWAVLTLFAGERSAQVQRIRFEHELQQMTAKKAKRRG